MLEYDFVDLRVIHRIRIIRMRSDLERAAGVGAGRSLFGQIGQNIQFNGSSSYDNDGWVCGTSETAPNAPAIRIGSSLLTTAASPRARLRRQPHLLLGPIAVHPVAPIRGATTTFPFNFVRS